MKYLFWMLLALGVLKTECFPEQSFSLYCLRNLHHLIDIACNVNSEGDNSADIYKSIRSYPEDCSRAYTLEQLMEYC
ncbi:hypothetical protein O3G_MSEX014573 [Manduca sexta]|uniref:Uncharacterized protein n=1 Tax=Manduca sexta TaxID=7130 RepID=A0A921ZUR2_MANSE|nr:hypothetical protein O3G_MSEX014573 [Manduca sexta]